MYESVVDAVSFTPLSSSSFESNQTPDYYGGLDPRNGFGGWSIAFGINAAAATVGPGYNVYSAMGNFLRTTSTAHKVIANVTTLRDTKSFATRRVELLQGSLVACITVDFIKPSTASLLTYSGTPRKVYSSLSESISVKDQIEIARGRGVNDNGIKQWQRRFGARHRKYDQRVPADSMLGHILSGLTERWPDQSFDALSMPEKTTCEYVRHHQPLESHLEHVLAIAYVQDSYMPFTPFLYSKLPFSSVGAIGSLDFALRIFTSDLNLNEWSMTEEETVVAAESRTYSESKMWDKHGRLIAGMTQQGLLKPSPAKL